jgi:UDP-N-acetyl-D-galactosamine dehydrogenase
MAKNRTLPKDVTIVGLGYVGLPLALAFASELPTKGFDVDVARVEGLQAGTDRNREVPDVDITESELELTSDTSCITDSEFIVVTVPTPVTDDYAPDLSLLESASAMIGVQLRGRTEGLPAPIIVYESTTYPGCTEEFCGPIIERESGLKSGEGFFLGYSPERTNFGDLEHDLETVIKVVSGQTPEVAQVVSDTYGLIAKAGTHMAANIKTGEASKVIENVQRDLNIALFNELAMIFDRMGIESSDVFDAAATKWNFHRYQPGLVGGHCIPVDPYYLTYAAAKQGYDAEVVLAGRAVNEAVPTFIAEKLAALLVEAGKEIDGSKVLVLGLTFKPDISDIRNTKTLMLLAELQKLGIEVVVHDPNVPDVALGRMGVAGHSDPLNSEETWDAVVVTVDHREFREAGADKIASRVNQPGVFVDISGSFANEAAGIDGLGYWRP